MKRLIAVCAFAALTALMACFPLRWAAGIFLPDDRVYDRISGTIWNGSIDGLEVGDSQLDRINFKLKPLKILSGEPLAFSAAGPGVSLSGQADFGRLQDTTMRARIDRLPLNDPRLAGLVGQLEARIETLKWDNKCIHASGRAQTDVLQQNQNRLNWQGPVLSGPIVCEGDDLAVKLSGESAAERVTANIIIYADGRYRAEAFVTTRDSRAGIGLPLLGFNTVRDGEYSLLEEGRWIYEKVP